MLLLASLLFPSPLAAAPADAVMDYGTPGGLPDLLRRGFDCAKNENGEEAIALYRQAIRMPHAPVAAFLRLSELHANRGQTPECLAVLEKAALQFPTDGETWARLVYWRALLMGRAPARVALGRLTRATSDQSNASAWHARGQQALAWGLSGGGDTAGAVEAFEAAQTVAPSDSLATALSNHREGLAVSPPNAFGISGGMVLGTSSRLLSVDGGFGSAWLSLGFENRFRLTAAYGFTGLAYDTNRISVRTNITTRPPPGPPVQVTNVSATTNWIPRLEHDVLLSGAFSSAVPWYRDITLGAKAVITGGLAASNLYSGFASVGAVWGSYEPRLAFSYTFGDLVQVAQGTLQLQARFGEFQPGASVSVIQAFASDPAAPPLPGTQWSGSAWIRFAKVQAPAVAFEIGADVGARRYFLSPDGFETVLIDENPTLTARASLWFRLGDANAMRLAWKQAFGPTASTAYGVFWAGLEFPF